MLFVENRNFKRKIHTTKQTYVRCMSYPFIVIFIFALFIVGFLIIMYILCISNRYLFLHSYTNHCHAKRYNTLIVILKTHVLTYYLILKQLKGNTSPNER